MKLRRVERHVILDDKNVDRLCFLSKNLYNYALYQIRQHFFKTKKRWSEYTLTTQLAKENQVDYRALPAQTSQQIIKVLYKNFKSFFKATKKNIKARIPKYKHKTKGRNIVIFTNQQVKIKDSYIHFPKIVKLNPLKTKISSNQLKQVRIVPQATCYIMEVVYEIEQKENRDLNENLYLGIDLGIDNFVTLVSNQSGLKPVLVNGKIIKSVNQFYNKIKANLQSMCPYFVSNRLKMLTFKRNQKIDNYLHHVSKFVIEYALNHKIKTIIIGKNKGWKQNVNIGKINNQKFTLIPYDKLIKQIQYKAENVGIKVIIQEEFYTNKCDALAKEEIKKHETYLGKRIKRGLFQSSISVLINADVNGALNILRKVIGDGFISEILADRSCVLQPERINPLQRNLIKNVEVF